MAERFVWIVLAFETKWLKGEQFDKDH